MRTSPRKYSNRIRFCVECLLRVGFGCKRIAAITRLDHSLIAKWRRLGPTSVRLSRKAKSNWHWNNPIWRGERLGRRELVEQLIIDEYMREQRKLRRFDEQHHWGKHIEFSRWQGNESAKRQYKNRYQNGADPTFILRRRLAVQLTCALRKVMLNKSCRTFDLIGCTPQQFKTHIQAKFTKGMTWENRRKWDIDHIIPCAAFDLTREDEQRRCFHYSNLRPLWRRENRRKHDTMPDNPQPELLLTIPTPPAFGSLLE